MPDDFDSPWKEALDGYFEPFLALLFPAVHAGLDWSRGCESLDKEFQQIVREAELGRRYVDKLVKVWTIEGEECWVLIHVEVQTTRDPEFPLRMYVYHYRIFDRYNKPVVSLAVLADEDDQWRPTEYRQGRLGCESLLRFPTVKLQDFVGREAELEASRNLFAKIVLAHLKAQETRGDPTIRRAWKLRLVRGLYDCGLDAKDGRELFRVIDWLMGLPVGQSQLFWLDVAKFQEEKRMPFISTPELVGRWVGMRIGIKTVLKMKFGEAGLALMPQVEAIYGEENLQAVLDALETATDLDEVRRVISQSVSAE